MAEFYPHLPVPISKRAVTKTIPYSQDGPGKARKKHDYQTGEPCLSPDPSEKDEEDQYGMKHEKKFIQKSVHRTAPV